MVFEDFYFYHKIVYSDLKALKFSTGTFSHKSSTELIQPKSNIFTPIKSIFYMWVCVVQKSTASRNWLPYMQVNFWPQTPRLKDEEVDLDDFQSSSQLRDPQYF